MKNILGQLARTGLLPDDQATAILAGGTPPVEEVVLHLVIAAWDGYAVLTGDPQTSRHGPTVECRNPSTAQQAKL